MTPESTTRSTAKSSWQAAGRRAGGPRTSTGRAAPTRRSGRRVERCWPHRAAGGFLAARPPTSDATRRRPARRRPVADRGRRGPGTVGRPVQAAGADRRGRDGRRLPGRAGAAGPAAGGAEGDQAGDGHRPGGGPVRGRAAGAGADGPPEHRQGARRRGDPVGPAVLRHGAGQGRPDHPSTATSTGSPCGSGWSCSSRSARRCSTPTRRGSSTATSSRPTSWSPLYDGRPVPKVIDFGVAKATGQPLTDADAVHRLRSVVGHAGVHEPGAGRAEPARRRHPQRRVQPRGAAVRAADRAPRRWSASG